VTTPDLQDAAVAARNWLARDALPIWGTVGVDELGAFHEQMDFGGRPDLTCPRRMRVQARQLYVFSEAAVRGWWGPARQVAERGFEALTRACWAPDGQAGFIHTLSPDLQPLDVSRDAYDHAFGLFAACWYYRASNDERALSLAHRILDFLDQNLSDPINGGFLEGLPPTLPRRSNPHMHLLEACLAGYAFTGDAAFADRARSLIGLFAQHFFDPYTGTYGEYFTPDWTPAPGAYGRVVEPGHHCEWVWLLDWAGRLGINDGEAYIGLLYAWAMRHGLDEQGFAIDECDRAGRPTRRSRRAWVQTELIKAHLAMARRGVPGAGDRAAGVAAGCLSTYLATDVPGLWVDQFDAAGASMSRWAPASTLYHLVVAFRELLLFSELPDTDWNFAGFAGVIDTGDKKG
jgi:mannose-6-phosphate isomerase